MPLTKQRLLITILFMALAVSAVPTQAHQQWVFPNFFTAEGDSAWVSFDHTFSDQRFHASSAPSPYYQWWFVSPDHRKRSVQSLFIGRTKVVGEVELTEPGTYRLEAEEPNMVWTKLKIDDKDVWQPGPRSRFEDHEIVESKIYFAKAMAYVSLGPVSAIEQGKSGEPLELLFQQHPNELQAGRAIGVTLLSLGKPAANSTLQLFSDRSAGHDPTSSCVTDSKGACEIVIESAGRYLLRTEMGGATPDDPTTDGFSYSLSVAVEVGPKASGAGE